MNLNQFDHIELAFENVESLVIPAAEINFLYVGGLTDQLRFTNRNGLTKMKKAKYFRLSVPNKESYHRLTEANDIVDVAIKQWSGGQPLYFAVEYNDDISNNNENQTTETTADEIKVVVCPHSGPQAMQHGARVC